MKRFMSISVAAIPILLAGCGLSTPEFNNFASSSATTPAFVRSIVGYVRCELAAAAYANEASAPWLVNWSAIIDLTLSVDEQSAVAPDATFTDYLSSRSKSFPNGSRVDVGRKRVLGLGVSVSALAKRNLKISWYEDFAELIAERKLIEQKTNHDCRKLGEYPIAGDIQIADTIGSAVFAASVGGLMSRDDRPVGPLKVVEHQVTFQTDFNADANPGIVLFDVAVNPVAPFLSGSHVRKNDLLITMGPVADKEVVPLSISSTRARKAGPIRRAPSAQVVESNLAANIGMAVDR
jgi:hypothetical protein